VSETQREKVKDRKPDQNLSALSSFKEKKEIYQMNIQH